MIIHCCRNRSNDYQKVKPRYNPTFVHHAIFQAQTPREKQPRFSRTFYSSGLETQGYNIRTIHENKQKNVFQQRLGENVKVISADYSHQRRLEDLYPKTRIDYESKQKWFDHAKEDYLNSVRNCHFTQTLRQRKVMQLSSSPVFLDFDYETRTKNPITSQFIQREVKQNPQIQTALVKQQPIVQADTEQMARKVLNQQNDHTQTINKDSNNGQNHYLDDQITGNVSHNKNILENYGQQKTRQSKKKDNLRRLQSSPKPSKPVTRNPTFALIRGNKIDNHLHRK